MDFDLQFDEGKISAVHSDIIVVDELHSYEFSAETGQVISIAVTSKKNDANFDFLYQEDNGDWVYVDDDNGSASEKKAWTGSLPASHNGKYLIELTNYFSGVDIEYDLFVGISVTSINNADVERKVSDNFADNISIGMTLSDVMEKMADKSVTLGTDREGVISLEVLTGSKFLMALYMDTDCICHESKVKLIEAWGREFITEAGVFPTMPLTEAISIYGGLESIEFFEVEAREFATFNNHPNGIFFEVYGGDFPDNENITQGILPDAQVVALWVRS